MKAFLKQAFHSLRDSFMDLLPIILVVLFFQFAVLQQPLPNLATLLAGILMVMLGLALFINGLKLALFPLGEEMAFNFVPVRLHARFWHYRSRTSPDCNKRRGG